MTEAEAKSADDWIIQFQYNLNNNVNHQATRDRIKRSTDKLKDSLGEIKNHTKATVILETFRGSAENAMRAAEAFKRGDPFSGSAAILQSIGSLAGLGALFGPYGLAVATAIQAIASIAASILSFFKPEESGPTLEEIIEKLLKNEHAKDLAEKLKSANQVFKKAAFAFKLMDDESKTIHEILAVENFITGPGELRLNDGLNWLINEENQGLDLWEQVFAAYFGAIAAHLTDMMTASSKLVAKAKAGVEPSTEAAPSLVSQKLTKLSEDRRIMFAILWYNFQQLEAIGEALEEAVANKGAVWHVGNNRKLYHRAAVVRRDRSWPKWEQMGETTDVFAVGTREKRVWTIEASKRIEQKLGDSGKRVERIMEGTLRTGVPGDGQNSLRRNVASCSLIARPAKTLGSAYTEDMVVYISDGRPVVDFWQVERANWHPTPPLDLWREHGGGEHDVDQVWAVSIPANLGDDKGATVDRFYFLTRTGTEGKVAAVHYVDMTEELAAMKDKSSRPPITPPAWIQVLLGAQMTNAGIRGITGDESHLVAFGQTKIWRLPHAKVRAVDAANAWKELAGPSFSAGSINRDWSYTDVSLCRDGTMLVVADQQLWLRGSEEEGGRWQRAEDTQAIRAQKAPVLAYATFTAVRELAASKLKDFKTSELFEELRIELADKGLLKRDSKDRVIGIVIS